MQHHELEKYLEFTVNKKPDKWKNINIFAHEPTGIFKKILKPFREYFEPESLTEWSELF